MSLLQKTLDRYHAQRQNLASVVAEETILWQERWQSHIEVKRRREYRRSLAKARDYAHYCFDKLWQCGFMTRNEAYIWLSREMDIPGSECHMANFDIGLCEVVIQLANEQLLYLASNQLCGRLTQA